MSDAKAWMPLYVGDYLGATARLTTEQHGAYLLLIMDYWRNGPMPNDDAVLAQITRMKAAAWRKSKAAVLQFFEQNSDGFLIQKRVEKEIANAQENAQRRSEKAKKAAISRWERAQGKHATSNAPSIDQAMLDKCAPPSPSSEKENIPPPPTSLDNPARAILEQQDRTKYAFFGKTIRLSSNDLKRWQDRYHAVSDINAELGSLDDWLQGRDERVRKNWFHTVSGALNKKHQEAMASAKDGGNSDCSFTGPC